MNIKPITVWFGDTQLTGEAPLALCTSQVTPAQAIRQQTIQRQFFGATCSQKPTYQEAKRRVGSTYKPRTDGSILLADEGYTDAAQSYDFRITLPIRAGDTILPNRVRSFENALTGATFPVSWADPYFGSGARWKWLIDTYDNPDAIGPRPALNILGPDKVYENPGGTLIAREAIYDGGDTVADTLYRRGEARVTFRTHPQVIRLAQSYVKNPTIVGSWDQGPYPDSDANLLTVRGPAIILVQWTGTKRLVQTDPTQPVRISIAGNGWINNEAFIEYDTSRNTNPGLPAESSGALGIGWDYIHNDYLTGAYWTPSGSSRAHGSFLWSETAEQKKFWLSLMNGEFQGEGDVYLSAIYAAENYCARGTSWT